MWSGQEGYPESAVTAPSGQEGVSREQEGARCRTTRRTPEQGKVHQVAKRVLNCQEDAESLGKRTIARKVLSDQEGLTSKEKCTMWPRGC